MKPQGELVTFTEAGKRLGVLRHTIADLVRVHGIPVYPIPLSGPAKGLDRKGLKRLQKLLKPQAVSA